jgi:diaminobutyrate-2-oxoglutarate transaminase
VLREAEGAGTLDEPVVRMPLPGPESARLLERQEQYESSARTYPRRLPIGIRRGAGSYVEDVDGNVFIDFLTGAGVLALGHSHPEVTEAVRDQLSLLSHGLDFPTVAKDEFTAFLLSRLPEEMQGRTKVQFCGPTGANAIEAALKLCKTATGRGDVVAFQGAFHGSTHGAMSISGLVSQRDRVANTMPGVHFFPFPYALRCPLPGPGRTVGARCLEYLERSLTDPLGGVPLPAAVVLEAVQGEGGVVPAPREFMQGVRRLTRELGVPLVVDEVQTGFGRTGTWFAFQRHDIAPDVVVASKAIGGIGMPIAVMLYDESLDVWGPGAHTGTFRGNQLAFAAGVAAGRIIERDGVLEQVRDLGDYALAALERLAQDHAIVEEARGSGLMLGIEIVDPSTAAPDGRTAAAIQRAALERGLIVEVGGRDDAVVRLLPPLNVTRKTLDQALGILGVVVGELAA